MIGSPLSRLVAFAEVAVQPRDLGDEVVEAPVGGGELAERPDEQRARPTRPQKKRQMREITALREGAGEVVHGKLCPVV